MRRILAVALLVLFSILLIEPAVFASDNESSLPACCRRDGKHHCAMMAMDESGPSIQPSKCRSFPESVITALPNAGVLKTVPAVAVSVLNCPAYHPTDTYYRVTFHSTCQKRGPPTLLFT